MKLINKPISELNEGDFRIYLEFSDRDSKLAPSTMNIHNSALQCFFDCPRYDSDLLDNT